MITVSCSQQFLYLCQSADESPTMPDVLSVSVSIQLLLCLKFMSVMSASYVSDECKLDVISRTDWGARDPKKITPMANPVDTVVIHHSYIPPACDTLCQCKAAMRAMQNYHMDDRGWDDIGYSFAIGLDHVFEGRMWDRVGAHAPPYNNRSIGIVFIGDYTDDLPSADMLCQCHQLIEYGVSNGHIRSDYQLIGHRQARDTECPGDRLYNLIKTWPHWKPLPS